jgi:hypothetical protein
MSIRSRIDRLEQSTAAECREVCIFAHGEMDDFATVPGSIEPWPNGRGHNMVVPAEHDADPIRGLSDEQRAFLRPGDKVRAAIWVLHEDEPRPLKMG